MCFWLILGRLFGNPCPRNAACLVSFAGIRSFCVVGKLFCSDRSVGNIANWATPAVSDYYVRLFAVKRLSYVAIIAFNYARLFRIIQLVTLFLHLLRLFHLRLPRRKILHLYYACDFARFRFPAVSPVYSQRLSAPLRPSSIQILPAFLIRATQLVRGGCPATAIESAFRSYSHLQ